MSAFQPRLPVRITLLRARGEWRHSITPEGGGFICGRLGDLPDDADPDQARRAAEAMLARLGREFHGAELTVSWDGLSGTVTPAQR
ncbi:hypothetical protein E6W39_36365 [Kitasatospora acidiphila]|uniref:Uncharacterized protein n=1 Tax=Kitasatospora acidiphila TaxID=2567942 RepID=A0A540WE34_9ACTN|nr:hypothetical protein [Kitasatospora acidiphila]TQF06674.1 hypothetical protein E6W39_36365 [Kitasatospora acidiphila]